MKFNQKTVMPYGGVGAVNRSLNHCISVPSKNKNVKDGTAAITATTPTVNIIR